MGEGSNGGIIFPPGTVRDPLPTLGILLMALADSRIQDCLFRTLNVHDNGVQQLTEPWSVATVLGLLPQFQTTGAYEDRAVLRIRTTDHRALKKRYEDLFLRNWPRIGLILHQKFGITSWEEIQYEGTHERRGFGPAYRTGDHRGGLKILLKNDRERVLGFFWMRGSGTEPVFRIMAEIESIDPADEAFLLELHRDLVEQADCGT
jgi:phosphoglucomutase